MTLMQLYELRAKHVLLEKKYGSGLWVILCDLFARLWLRKINKIRATGDYSVLTKEIAEKPQGRRKHG